MWAGYQPAACFQQARAVENKKPPRGRLPADSPPHILKLEFSHRLIGVGLL
jgi:hypothetical protein